MLTTPYPIPANEEERLRALAEYNLMDSPPEEDFDRLVGLAARLFNVPIVLISLLARDRQFFKARVGLDVCETSRDVSFCAHAILQDDILFIPDATKDPRFASNPLVLGPPFIRFYAGKPLAAPKGEKVGTVCLIDSEPHAEFTGGGSAEPIGFCRPRHGSHGDAAARLCQDRQSDPLREHRCDFSGRDYLFAVHRRDYLLEPVGRAAFRLFGERDRQ